MRLFWFATLMLVATSLPSMEIYRSIDANGNVVYSDRPQDDKAEPIYIAAHRRPVSPLPPQSSAEEPPQNPSPGTLMAEVERDPTAEERAELCQTARERLNLYSNARRLYRSSEDGERQYLESEEIDAVRAAAAADVETWCG